MTTDPGMGSLHDFDIYIYIYFDTFSHLQALHDTFSVFGDIRSCKARSPSLVCCDGARSIVHENDTVRPEMLHVILFFTRHLFQIMNLRENDSAFFFV